MGEARGLVGGRRYDGDSSRGWFRSGESPGSESFFVDRKSIFDFGVCLGEDGSRRAGRWHGSGVDELEDAGPNLALGLGMEEVDGSVGALGLVPDPADVVAFFEENADFLGLSKQGPLCPQVNR